MSKIKVKEIWDKSIKKSSMSSYLIDPISLMVAYDNMIMLIIPPTKHDS
jgi:hypothetical protein